MMVAKGPSPFDLREGARRCRNAYNSEMHKSPVPTLRISLELYLRLLPNSFSHLLSSDYFMLVSYNDFS